MNDTPRTDELLRCILDRDGQVGSVLGNAPEEWVVLARALERELTAVTAERDNAGALARNYAERLAETTAERDALQKTVLRLMDEKLAEQDAHTETAKLLYETTAERDKLNNDLTTLNSQYDSLVLERDRLKASNLQLVTDLHREMDRHDFREADKDRLNWLEGSRTFCFGHLVGLPESPSTDTVRLDIGLSGQLQYPASSLRAAIDAARKETE